MATNPLPRLTGTTQALSAENVDDTRLWESLVDSAAVPDVYHRPGYLRAYQAIDHGKALAVLVETSSARALFPLLLRPLNALPFPSDESGFDAATPYGYGGLLLLDDVRVITATQGRELLHALREWCSDNQVISAHVRLHPVLRQEEWFTGALGEGLQLHLAGSTIAIDVRRWHSKTSSIATLDKGRRSDLNFARRHLRLTWTAEERLASVDLQIFRELYEQRMKELQAGDYYHFPAEYYDSLAAGLGRRLDVAVAWLNGDPVGAALFMTDRVMAHYHLSATNDLGRTNKATTLIINDAAGRALSQGCVRLHLGGGAHGEDTLYVFKRSFGGDMYRYSYLSLICDAGRYSNLVERRLAASNLPSLRTNYFPEYRA